MVNALIQPDKPVLDTMEYEIHFLRPEGLKGDVAYCIITTNSAGDESWWDAEVSSCKCGIENILRVFRPDRVTISCQMRDLSADNPAFWACRLAHAYNRGEV